MKTIFISLLLFAVTFLSNAQVISERGGGWWISVRNTQGGGAGTAFSLSFSGTAVRGVDYRVKYFNLAAGVQVLPASQQMEEFSGTGSLSLRTYYTESTAEVGTVCCASVFIEAIDNAGKDGDRSLVVNLTGSGVAFSSGRFGAELGVNPREITLRDDESDASFANGSSLAVIGGSTDERIRMGVIVESGYRRLLVRGVGVGLNQFGVPGAPDVAIRIHMGNGSVLEFDNWSSGTAGEVAELQATMARLGAFPLTLNSTDAATLINLPAGAYTIECYNKTSASGYALVELYDAN